MNIQRKNYDFLGDPVGPYVHSVKHEGVLYLSGLTAFGTSSQTGEIEDQAREIFGKIEQICKSENAGLDSILKITSFVTDMSRMAQLRDVLLEFCGNALPASSLVQVNSLFAPDLKIEVEAVVAVDKTA